MNAASQISKVDQQIDAIRAQVIASEGRRPNTASEWQRAWDRHPELSRQENELFRLRGQLQIERDEAAAKMARTQKRKTVSRKCPTCGFRTLAA